MDNYNRARTRRFGPTFYLRLATFLGKRGLRYPDSAYSGAGVDSILDPPKRSPDVALYWALIGQAADDLIKLKFVDQALHDARSLIIREGLLSAEWIRGEYESTVPFEDACDAVGIEADMVREKFRAAGIMPEVV